MSRPLINCLLILYSLATLAALVYALTRISLLPKPLFWFSYGAMAPYQGYSRNNIELVAHGYTGKQVATIDLKSYFPTSIGEFTYRTWLPSARYRSPHHLKRQAERFASQLLVREAAAGRNFDRIELFYRIWPKSPEGFYGGVNAYGAHHKALITYSNPAK